MKFGNFEIRILPEVQRPEFTLVLAMLLSLVVLVVIVVAVPAIWITPSYNATDTTSVADVMKWRLDILSLIITAFGAWVGAGAAYFFGKENLKTATDTIMATVESPKAKLLRTKIQSLPPRQITRTFSLSDPFCDLYSYFMGDADAWFVPVVDKDKKLNAVLHEEGVYRYKLDEKNGYKTKENATIDDLIHYLDEKDREKIKKVAESFWVKLQSDNTLATADEEMSLKNTRLAIITDASDVPTHYITTGDIRRFLLK